jgi:hypothetical protein
MARGDCLEAAWGGGEREMEERQRGGEGGGRAGGERENERERARERARDQRGTCRECEGGEMGLEQGEPRERFRA